jgi:hypothetical protein
VPAKPRTSIARAGQRCFAASISGRRQQHVADLRVQITRMRGERSERAIDRL